MTTMKKKRTRSVCLIPRFTPGGSAEDRARLFHKFWIAASWGALALPSSRRIPPGSGRKKKDLARNNARKRRRQEFLELEKAIWSALDELGQAAMKGDEDAAKALGLRVISACQWFSLVENKRPELFEGIARGQLQWPVLAEDEPGWERDAVRRVARLRLGEDLQVLKVRFRRARGTDANLPARLWAKAAVRVIEEARWRSLMVAGLIRDFGSGDAMADFCMQEGWRLEKRPAWAKTAMSLEPFSRGSLPSWRDVIRQMIREDMPQFHQRPEWENQRRTGAASERDSIGEIQNAILDDIVSALARLAPEKLC